MNLNPIAWLESHVNEQFVVNMIANIKKSVAIAENDVNEGIQWLISVAPSITSQANLLMQLISELGMSNPQVSAALASVNTATSALNALAAASKAGETNAQSLVAAYTAVKSAVGNTALATASVAASAVPVA